MRSLLVFAGGEAGRARTHAQAGGMVLAWTGGAATALAAAGVEHTPLPAVLDLAARDAVDEAAMAWTKEWGRRPLRDGRPFRDLLDWRGVSLWWFAELYLHHSTAAPRYVRLVETFARVLAATGAEEVDSCGLSAEEELLLARTCIAGGALYLGRAHARPRPTWRVSLASRVNGLKTLLTWLKNVARARPRIVPAGERPRVLFLSHAAFWRTRPDPETGALIEYEHYFDQLIPEAGAGGLAPAVLTVGPRTAFRRRDTGARLSEWLALGTPAAADAHADQFVTGRVLAETRRASAAVRELWGWMRRSPGARELFIHRGVPFFDLAQADLAGTLLLQLPWAVRTCEETAEALKAFAPAALCLYAESSGLGRCALAAAQDAGVATVAIQHGILYPKYYSYRHEPDEAACPRPDRTAVFGEAAVRFLVERGGYPPASLVVTGSPKFDELLARARAQDRGAVRTGLGVGAGEHLVLVASRFRSIRETHEALGEAFGALVRATAALPGVRLLVKPHPAEPATAYEEVVRALGAAHARVLPASADLVSLLPAADLLVTVESLSAVEALVLGLPLVVLNMPTNLRELVEAGAALGVSAGEDPGEAVRAALHDPGTREGLAAARARYLSDVAHGVDGQATARIVALLRRAAGAPGGS